MERGIGYFKQTLQGQTEFYSVPRQKESQQMDKGINRFTKLKYTTMSWLPADYKEPEKTSGKYMKFKEGENVIRILSVPIHGAVGWTVVDGKKKPIRKRPGEAFVMGEVEMTEKNSPKHFIAFAVWNYLEKKVQILEVTQSSIYGKINLYSKKASWGDPTQYDFIITKTGEGMATEYEVTPEPKSELAVEAQAAWDKVKSTFDLNKLYEGGDPFSGEEKHSDEINVDDIPFG